MSITNMSSLIGLSLLSGGSGALQLAPVRIESRAARLARAQFTLPAVTPPWKDTKARALEHRDASAIARLPTLVDLARETMPPDVSTSFTTYKALDRLRVLAEAAVRLSPASSVRPGLQTAFERGLFDLRSFLAAAPRDQVTLAFGQAMRRVEGVKVDAPAKAEVRGAAVVRERPHAVPGLVGNEKFAVTLRRPGASDRLTVDLAAVPQPPTLDGIAGALNDAIAAVPMLNLDGSIAVAADGTPLPRWPTRFAAVRSADGWGLELRTRGGERISIEQLDAAPELMVTNGQAGVPAVAISRLDLSSAELGRTSLSAYRPQALPGSVAAPMQARAMVSDGEGFTYLVGTVAGDLGANIGDGGDDLFLTKLDNRGETVWQRSLGAAGEAQGAAVALTAEGDLVVAGTVSGKFDGARTDGDMLVTRFSAAGDELSTSLIRSEGADTAQAIAVGKDGSIFVGGNAASGRGDAFLARLDAGGRLLERRVIDSGGVDGVRALQVDRDGYLLALTAEGGRGVLRRIDGQALGSDLGRLDLGMMDARTMAVSGNGTIAVAGAAAAVAGGRDGFVTRIDSALASLGTTFIASAGADGIDSIAFVGELLYAAGRTSGDLGAARSGAVDAFVSRIDGMSGDLSTTAQWGRPGATSGPVHLTAVPGGSEAVGALGFRRGTLNPGNSPRLVAQTSIREGDEFSIRVEGGPVKRIKITAEDTLVTLSERMRKVAGKGVLVTVAKMDGASALRIEAAPGHVVDLRAGPEGEDALRKLGFAPSRLSADAILSDKAPRVRPGGQFGLELSTALNLNDAKAAALALQKINSALSMTQTAFRSLYWDSSKEALADSGSGTRGGHVSPYLARQTARYQDALARLSAGPTASFGV